ncbi:hypothetical protein [Bradyrhizobium sp. ISRA442]
MILGPTRGTLKAMLRARSGLRNMLCPRKATIHYLYDFDDCWSIV